MRLSWLQQLLLLTALLAAIHAEQPQPDILRQQFSMDADDSDDSDGAESESPAAAGGGGGAGGGMVLVRSELTVVDEEEPLSSQRAGVKGAEGDRPPPSESAGHAARGSPGQQPAAAGRPQEPLGAEEPAEGAGSVTQLPQPEQQGPADAITEVEPPDLAGQEPLLKSIGDSYFKPSSPPKEDNKEEDDSMTEQERQGEGNWL